MRALGLFGRASPDVIAVLLRHLRRDDVTGCDAHDPDRSSRHRQQAAVRAFEDRGHAPPAFLNGLLQGARHDREEGVRWAAAYALGNVARQDSARLDWLRRALVDKSEPTTAYLLKFALTVVQVAPTPGLAGRQLKSLRA